MRRAFQIRPFRAGDEAALLNLMRELAVFEGYINDFAVTESDLCRHGLGEKALFKAYVATESAEALMGMAVTYRISWTYHRRPILVLKELFVAESYRGSGIGKALMNHALSEARAIGASRVEWLVLPNNNEAKQFYAGLGGKQDAAWERWILPIGQAR